LVCYIRITARFYVTLIATNRTVTLTVLETSAITVRQLPTLIRRMLMVIKWEMLVTFQTLITMVSGCCTFIFAF